MSFRGPHGAGPSGDAKAVRKTRLIGEFERDLHAAMGWVSTAITETHERLSRPEAAVPDLDKRAERMLHIARSNPFGPTPALLETGKARLRLCRRTLAAARTRIEASAVRLETTRACVQRCNKRLLPGPASD
jgi:hypothetical protein